MKPSTKSLYHQARPLKASELIEVYQTLYEHFGHQKWWPGDTPFEIILGAILTQNTAWRNVEKAISSLKQKQGISLSALREVSEAELAESIRSAGFFKVKARRIKNFINFLDTEFGGRLERMFASDPDRLREGLLSVNGIGPETADSILLYAGNKAFFVIDAYTRRVLTRHRLMPRGKRNTVITYDDWQALFHRSLPRERHLFNDFHAQIVQLAKAYCKSSNPNCMDCPLRAYI